MITDSHELIPGSARSGILLITDHASNRVPDGIDLGVAPERMGEHIAIDVGVDGFTRQLSRTLDARAIVARVSRLVIDLNREPEAQGLIPVTSDGVDVPGNRDLPSNERKSRIARYHQAYHRAVEALMAESPPQLIVSVHSFTPRLAIRPEEARPWQVGVLYNTDDRAARIAIPMLEQRGINTGDNLPYSGRVLNYTMNRHAEANGIPYLGFEIRQDLIGGPVGISDWAGVLAPIVSAVRQRLYPA